MEKGAVVPADLKAEAEVVVALVREAAACGVAEAEVELGFYHSKGAYGVKQDYAEAVKWYRKAAKQNHANSQYNLAVMYYYGRGVQQDHAEAAKWARKAAAQGLEQAQRMVDVLSNA